MQFGWEDDGGLGDELIRQVLASTKTATCCPKSLYEQGDLQLITSHVGRVIDLTDKDDIRRGRVRLVEVFETTWKNPDSRLVRGEGYATTAEFQLDHADVWNEWLGGAPTPDLILLVEVFELVESD